MPVETELTGKKPRARVVFLYANEPDALTVQKIEFLAREPDFEVHLVYWHRRGSLIGTPFSLRLPEINVIRCVQRIGRNLPAKMFFRAVVILRMAAILWRLRPRVAHACSIDMLISARMVRWLRPIELIFDLQDTTDTMLRPAVLSVQRRLYRNLAAIFVTSPKFDSEFLARFALVP